MRWSDLADKWDYVVAFGLFTFGVCIMLAAL